MRYAKQREMDNSYHYNKYHTDPDFRDRVKLNAKARSTALTRLSHKYPNVYRKLYEEVKAELEKEL